jgi:hypothetical protein
MMRRLIPAVAVFVTLLAATLVRPAFAWNPFADTDCTGTTQNSTVCQDVVNNTNYDPSKDPLTGADGLIVRVSNVIAVIAGIAAVVIIILSGLRFIQAGGNAEDVAGARRSLIYASVGLVGIVVARVLVQIAITVI